MSDLSVLYLAICQTPMLDFLYRKLRKVLNKERLFNMNNTNEMKATDKLLIEQVLKGQQERYAQHDKVMHESYPWLKNVRAIQKKVGNN